jgi:hypothetical protein
MQTHSDQVLCVTEELSSEGDHKIGGISALIFLHFACEDEHLGSGMLHLKLNRAGNTSFRMVAASEVTKILSMWFTTIFLRAELFKKF